MMKIVFQLILAIAIFTPLTGQSDLDSMMNLEFPPRDTNAFHNYTQIIVELFPRDLELARTYIDKQLKLAEEIDNPNLTAFAANINAVYYSNIAEYKKAKELFEDVMNQYRVLGNMERVSAVLNNISICNQYLGQLDLALENQMRSLEIKDSIGASPIAIAASYYNISNIFWEIKDVDQSNTYIYKAMEIYKQVGDEGSVIDLKNLLASNLTYFPDSVYKAKDILNECLTYYKRNGLLNNEAGVYEQYGLFAIDETKYNEAEEWFSKALVIAENEGEQSFPGILYRRLSNVNKLKGNYNVALAYAQKALNSSQELGLKKKEINDHLELSTVYEKLGNYKKALNSYETFHIMNDSILGNEKVLAMSELEKKYQTEKKEQEIVLLQAQKKNSKLRQIALILALAALSIILIAIWIYFHQRNNRNKLEKEKLDQEIEFKNKDLESKKQELTVFALQIAQKNELLENIKTDIQSINQNKAEGKSLQSLINSIQFNQNDQEAWESFKNRFEQVHVDFNKRMLLKHPEITSNDLRIIALIKMNLSSKEIANILNISLAGIKKARYRLRKKLNLVSEDNLDHFIVSF